MNHILNQTYKTTEDLVAIYSKVSFVNISSVITTLRRIDMVMYMTMLMYLVLAEQICYAAAAAAAAVAEQVPRLASANTSCEHVGNTAAANITCMKLPS